MQATQRQVRRGMALTTQRSRSARSLHTPSSLSTLVRVVPRNAAPECSSLAEWRHSRRRHGSHSRRRLPSRPHRLGPTVCTQQGAPVALVGTRASVALDECSWAIIYEPEPGGEHDRPADEAERHDRLRGGVHDAHRVGAGAGQATRTHTERGMGRALPADDRVRPTTRESSLKSIASRI